jgi:DNA polymerase-3 subunit delta'
MDRFPDFFGNVTASSALARMLERDRIPQTILLCGPEGIGKATLARRFAAALLGDAAAIERDDLSLPHNVELIAEREKLATDKRSEDPLFFSAHPDFVTFPPDGPLRQISIHQMRLLKERAQLSPMRGRHRVFLIDHIDRANEQAANSLLKVLEEPPPHLILILTAENVYDLLPTIRSRSVIIHMTALAPRQMEAFAAARGWEPGDRRISLAAGSPGNAVTMDWETWDERRRRMLILLEVASGQARFSAWVKDSEKISSSKSEKLESYLELLYSLLEDVLLARHGFPPRRHRDLEAGMRRLAGATSFEWLAAAVKRVDEMAHFARRNIQKGVALDAFALELRAMPR